ncbi:multisubunit Na+/H+ antiporter MnhF subunit [Catenulispora sp. EB89]|uniref:FUSC family protein n=1 Tax=Catenulispora sp. EB89 TaxID=3156257 RepID=UPI003517FDDC
MSTNLIAIGSRRSRSVWRPAALRAAVVAMAAVLCAFGSAIWIEHRAHLHVDIVIAAVAMTMTLGRVQLGAAHRDRLVGTVVVAVAAAGASEVSSLLSRYPFFGDAAFTATMAGVIWVRRFGPRATKAGTVVVVPFITLLVTHGEGVPAHAASYDLWCALIALVAAFWVAVFQLGGAALGFREQRVRPSPAAPVAPPSTPSIVSAPPASPAPSAPPAPSRTARIPASTRMACQMAVALGAAFALGHGVFHDHWPWAVLTAFIVCSGSRGRGDVLHKGVLRAAGAAVGTVVATAIAGAFPAGDRWSVVIIFTVLGLASWLREISYAFWAGSVTAALSLLYGYFGQSAPSLLETRLEAIVVGAAIGIAVSWFLLPVRTGSVVKRRLADALAALSAFLGAPMGDAGEVRRLQGHFRHAVTQLEQIARPLRAQRMLSGASDRADAVDLLHGCVEPVGTLAGVFAGTGAGPGPGAGTGLSAAVVPEWDPLRRAVAANVGAIRRALGGRPGTPFRTIESQPRSTAASALIALNTALTGLAKSALLTWQPPDSPPQAPSEAPPAARHIAADRSVPPPGVGVPQPTEDQASEAPQRGASVVPGTENASDCPRG